MHPVFFLGRLLQVVHRQGTESQYNARDSMDVMENKRSLLGIETGSVAHSMITALTELS
jgi:hypothetical protein